MFDVLGEGSLPVLVHVPHAGLAVPDDVRADIELDDEDLELELRRMTDHRTDVLAEGAVRAGAVVVVNRLSRLVVDPERFLDPGVESMEEVGMGAVYTRTSDGRPLRRSTPRRRRSLIDRYFVPYRDALVAVTDAAIERHRRVVLVDLHSYPSVRLPYEIGHGGRPQVCVGTDADHTPEWLAGLVEGEASRRAWSCARDTPFAGTYVPLPHLGRHELLSVMLELRRDLHLDEDAWAPHAGEPEVTAFVTDVVEGAARTLGA